nr:Cleavage and polyadenylation specificity factor [Haemonchus contortus]
MFPGVQQQPPVPGAMNDVEFEEIMNRNRTVASSAISRAVADAAGGDVKSATETILTAISLIKQSRVAQDDRCRVLVVSLQDTLNGIESKAYSGGGGSSRSKHRDRSRSRSRDRDRKRRRRSRSRSRSSSRSRSPRHSRGRYH